MSRTPRDRLLDGINEGYGALLSAVEDTEVRRHKVSRTVLAEARKGEHEVVELARQWIGSPTSFFDNFEAAVEVEARAQRRVLELGRDTVVGAADYRREMQRALRRLVRASRQAGGVVAESARDAYALLTARVREQAPEEAQLISPRPARRRPRTPRRGSHAAVPRASEVQALVP